MVAIMLSVNLNDIAIITIKNVDYHCTIYNISISKAINFIKTYILEYREYIYINIALMFSLLKTVIFNAFVLVYIKWLTVNIVWASINR